jgi:hypothetical protein
MPGIKIDFVGDNVPRLARVEAPRVVSYDFDTDYDAWVAWRPLVEKCQKFNGLPPETMWYRTGGVVINGNIMYVRKASTFDVQQARSVWAYVPSLTVCFNALDDIGALAERYAELSNMGIHNLYVWTQNDPKKDAITFGPMITHVHHEQVSSMP